MRWLLFALLITSCVPASVFPVGSGEHVWFFVSGGVWRDDRGTWHCWAVDGGAATCERVELPIGRDAGR